MTMARRYPKLHYDLQKKTKGYLYIPMIMDDERNYKNVINVLAQTIYNYGFDVHEFIVKHVKISNLRYPQLVDLLVMLTLRKFQR